MLLAQLKRRSVLLASVVAMTTLGIGALNTSVRSQGRTTIEIDGSSTVFPITEAIAEEFQIEKRGGIRVTVGISGTGGGFKKFCAGETDISNASRPIKDSEKELCAENGITEDDYVQIPVAYDAIAVVVNPGNSIDSITSEQLKTMWEADAEGEIMQWSDIDSSWPDADLVLFGPGADSGTFDYFNEAILDDGDSRTDYTPSEDDNILVQGISGEATALGYFGLAYYQENKGKVKALEVDGIMPSAQTIATYPLARPIFIYINKKAMDKKPEVKEFVQFYLDKAEEIVPDVGYVKLGRTKSEDPEYSYEDSQARFDSLF